MLGENEASNTLLPTKGVNAKVNKPLVSLFVPNFNIDEYHYEHRYTASTLQGLPSKLTQTQEVGAQTILQLVEVGIYC